MRLGRIIYSHASLPRLSFSLRCSVPPSFETREQQGSFIPAREVSPFNSPAARYHPDIAERSRRPGGVVRAAGLRRLDKARSEERRGGKEDVRTCRSWWWRSP